MKAIFDILSQIFSTIGFNYNEAEDSDASWRFNEFSESPNINYTVFELFIYVNFNKTTDYIEYINPDFKERLQKAGFHINQILYRVNGNQAEFRLYYEQLKSVG